MVSYQGFGLHTEARLHDGSYIAIPSISVQIALGLRGSEPLDKLPILHVERPVGESASIWPPPEIVVELDRRNEILALEYTNSNGGRGAYNAAQPFADSDLFRADPSLGTVVVLRRNSGPGIVDLTEIAANGDTIWQRHLRFLPQAYRPEAAARYIDGMSESLSSRRIMSRSRARKLVKEALYAPDYFPAVRTMVLMMSSGDVWMLAEEGGSTRGDTLRAWYAARRGSESTEPVRQVLLPCRLQPWDATNTHVWGVRRDDLGLPYIVGRRLVPPRDVRLALGPG